MTTAAATPGISRGDAPANAPWSARPAGAPCLHRVADITDLVGNTPLVRLRNVSRDLAPGVQVLAKAEFFNPGGSVKDRAALSMIRDGERRGRLVPGKTIIDASSGNTGIAYAWIGGALGYSVHICLPENASPERKRILKAYGAKVIFTSPLEGTDGAQRRVKEIVAADPERYFLPGPVQQRRELAGALQRHRVGDLGSDRGAHHPFCRGSWHHGHVRGYDAPAQGVEPRYSLLLVPAESPLHGLEGMKHLETAIVPGIWDPQSPDEELWCPTEDAYDMVKRLAREEGLFVGISSGGAVAMALQVARRLTDGVVVTILCDGADKYLSERFWDED
jgi:cysteine synthase B